MALRRQAQQPLAPLHPLYKRLSGMDPRSHRASGGSVSGCHHIRLLIRWTGALVEGLLRPFCFPRSRNTHLSIRRIKPASFVQPSSSRSIGVDFQALRDIAALRRQSHADRGPGVPPPPPLHHDRLATRRTAARREDEDCNCRGHPRSFPQSDRGCKQMWKDHRFIQDNVADGIKAGGSR